MGKLKRNLQPHNDGVVYIEWSNDDSRIISTSQDGTIHLFDSKENMLKRLRIGSDWVEHPS